MTAYIILNDNSWEKSLQYINEIMDTEEAGSYYFYLVDKDSTVDMTVPLGIYLLENRSISTYLKTEKNGTFDDGCELGFQEALGKGCRAIKVYGPSGKHVELSREEAEKIIQLRSILK